MSDTGDEVLGQRALDSRTPALKSAEIVEELLRRELARGTDQSVARRSLAERLGVARDVVDERLQVASRAREDPEAAKRVSQLRGRARGGYPAPLGIAGVRSILRLHPRELRLAVIEELEGSEPRSYRELVETIRTIRKRLAAPGGQQRSRKVKAAKQRSLVQRNARLSVEQALPSVLGRLRDFDVAFERLENVELTMTEWWRLVHADGERLGRKLARYLASDAPESA